MTEGAAANGNATAASLEAFAAYLSSGAAHDNPLAAEFGVYGASQLCDFLQGTNLSVSSHRSSDRLATAEAARSGERSGGGRLSDFDVVLLADMLDESLVAMQLRFGWSALDITYVRLLDSHHGTMVRFGRPLPPTLRATALPPELQAAVRARTRRDAEIYARARARMEALIAATGAPIAVRHG